MYVLFRFSQCFCQSCTIIIKGEFNFELEINLIWLSHSKQRPELLCVFRQGVVMGNTYYFKVSLCVLAL